MARRGRWGTPRGPSCTKRQCGARPSTANIKNLPFHPRIDRQCNGAARLVSMNGDARWITLIAHHG